MRNMKNYLNLVLMGVLMICLAVSAVGCNQNSGAATDGIDVDLTKLSSTMLTAEIDNIFKNSADYIGKTIKLSGPYRTIFFSASNQTQHFILIKDGDACCEEFMEFKLNGDRKFPDDYPEDNTLVEVVGEFNSYDERGSTYYYLKADDLKIIKAPWQ